MDCINVAIIIPCYNNGYLLTKMIECIIQQSYQYWELIIVDDGSTDNTVKIVQDYVRECGRIKLIQRDRLPKGSATCRNIGFSYATGKYVTHFDADDLISKTCIENRVKFMEENPNIDYASFPAKSFTDEKNLPTYSDKGKTYGIQSNKTDLLASFLMVDYAFSTWNNIYRRKSIEKITWDEKIKIYTDFSFIVPCILEGLSHKFSNLNEIDYFYRVSGNDGNMCSSFVSEEKSASTIYLFSKTLDSLKLRSDYKQRRQEFLQFIVLHFERLIADGSLSKTNDYLCFCKKYYSLLTISRLSIIKKVSLFFTNVVLRKLFLYFLTGILFLRKRSILLFGSTLKHWR